MQTIREALRVAGLRLEDLDGVAVGWDPAINLEAFNPAQSQCPRFLGELFYSVPNHLMTLTQGSAPLLSRQTVEYLDGTQLNVSYVTHHLAHAASFFCSSFDRAAIMTIDAFGERQSVLFAVGEGERLRTVWSQDFPHSLGAFYSTMTEYLGFRAQSDEWKVMGASSYGDPGRFESKLRDLVRLKDDGGFELDLLYFNHYQFPRTQRYASRLCDHLGLEPNEPGRPLTQEHYDFAAAAQQVTGDVYFHLLNQLHARTGVTKLVVAGGVAFNSVANGKIRQRTPFAQVFVPPVPDDSGVSLGAALYVCHQLEGRPREYVMTSNYLGPGYSAAEIQDALVQFKVRHRVVPNPASCAAKLVTAGKIIGWFQGRLEFGDRALGNRSILADPRDASMKDRVNDTVKYREPFRPFAPSILIDEVGEFFVDAEPTPFMENVFTIRPEKRALIPAVTHVDGTGRLQTVSREQNPLYFELIEEFRRLTGVPVVLNTSFNLNGEPIVCSPRDALRTFFSSGLDALVMGNCLVEKG